MFRSGNTTQADIQFSSIPLVPVTWVVGFFIDALFSFLADQAPFLLLLPFASPAHVSVVLPQTATRVEGWCPTISPFSAMGSTVGPTAFTGYLYFQDVS